MKRKVENGPRSRLLGLGLMILLPAGILAAVGLWSLRQDRVVALLAAREQAQRLVDRLVQRQLPDALRVTVGAVAGSERGAFQVSDPSEDPSYILAGSSIPRLAWRLDRTGAFVYPLAPQPPQPFQLSLEGMSPAQQELWWEIQVRMHEVPDQLKAITALEAMREETLPEPWQINTAYLLGVLNLELGLDVAAVEAFEQVLSFVGVGATGDWMRRLQQYSRLRLLELTLDQPEFSRSRRAWIDGMGSTALNRPTTLDGALLSALSEVALLPASERRRLDEWRRCFDQRSRALQLAALAEPIFEFRRGLNVDTVGTFKVEGWVEFEEKPQWLVTSLGDENGVWVFACDYASARRLVEEVLSTVTGPEWFGYTVKMGGEALADRPLDAVLLADASGMSTAGRMAPALEASVYLVDPDRLYARQRLRTVWFGGLIGFSLVVVLLGVVAAWRAFHRQQQLNELKTNFVSSVTHELRAPIASVRLMTEELQASEREMSPRARGYHRMVIQECLRLTALIENVLDLTRHDQGRREFELEPTDVKALLRETVELMNCTAQERKVTISWEEPDGEMTWELDGRSIQQALVNLIDNAVKHSPEGALVRVEARIEPDTVARGSKTRDPSDRGDRHRARETSSPQPSPPLHGREGGDAPYTPEHSLAPWGRGIKGEGKPLAKTESSTTEPLAFSVLRLSVADSGEGIPVADQERVFDRFYRRGSELRRETTGVGIGLTIVQQVVEAHGGEIELRSEAGQGSCFTLVLPERNQHGQNPDR